MGNNNEELEGKLFDVSARIDVLSGLLNGLYNIALGERSTALFDGSGGKDKAANWCITYYDLLSNSIWEVMTALEEQAEIIDECIKQL